MYFVFIFAPVFCEMLLFVKGDFINVDRVTQKAGNGLTLKIDGSFDLAKLLGFYFRGSTEKISSLRNENQRPAVAINTMANENQRPAVVINKMANENQRPAIRINTMATKVDTGMTQIEEIAMTTHKVKDSKMILEFTLHVFKQAMKVFDNIKEKTSGRIMKARVGLLAKSYQQKFTDFVQITREYAVRTSLGDQKVILNIIDTSIHILQRLVNFMMSDRTLPDDEADCEEGNSPCDKHLTNAILQREVDAEKEFEYRHVCVKYGLCRSAFGLKTVLQRCLKILATAPDDKLTQGVDAITEVLKSADFSKILDSRTQITFKEKLARFEKTEPQQARLAMNILLDAMIHLNSPIEVAPENAAIAKKTTAFYNILNELDSAIPANDRNRQEWADIEKRLQEWKDRKRSDIQDIMQDLMNNVSRGIEDMKPESALKIRNLFNVH